MAKVVNGLRKYPSRRVAALVFYAWKHTITTNVLGVDQSSSASTNSTSPPAADIRDCPASPHVCVVIDDDAADEVQGPPPSTVEPMRSTSSSMMIAALTSSPPARQTALAKSNMRACRPLEVTHSDAAPAAAPIARKRPLDMSPSDVKSYATTSYEAKLKASRHKLQMGCEREKRPHTMWLVRPDQLPRDNIAASKCPAIPTSHQHDRCKGTTGSIHALAPERTFGSAAPPYPAVAFVRAH